MRKLTTLVAVVILSSMVMAQTTGKISGHVTTEDGTPLTGANVVVLGTASGAATNSDGSFVILNVPIGVHSVKVDYIGYASVTMSNVDVKGGLTTRLNFALTSSAIAGEEVLVIGEKRLVEPSATNSVRTIGAEDIQNAASRSVTGMLELQPGVVIQNGELHIRGSREEEVAYTLDGADIKDPIGSGRLVSAIPEALSEIAVEAGGYGADVGGANSGVIRQTMRTGGSKFAGTARFETGDFGYKDMTATVGGPAGPIKYFIAVRNQHEDDWDPTFYDGFTIAEGE
ncbi:MAG: carboxypeptidase regulatory-like domain-containing protein, partial [Candidatus Marinimicrobia bacterium]|nr:carboxypeptidase regulatory-like domain-containing protein [Candidatus Neomarinimicrobiota bacterium]